MNGLQRVRPLLPLLLLIASCNGQTNVDVAKDTMAVGDTAAHHAPKSITRNVLQDKRGTYWFATWEGIISYDGKRFTNVTMTEGLEKFHVFSLLEDAAGILWFGTIGGGVYRYDGASFKLITTADGLADNSVLCMLQDTAGNIWFGTNTGASRYDGTTFTNFPIQDSTAINVNSIVQDRNGNLWFATRYGVASDLIRYDGRTFTPIERTPGTRFWNVRTVLEDRNGVLWIGGQDGLIRYDGGSFTQVSPYFTGYISEDRAGNLWISEDRPPKWVLNRSDGITATPVDTGRMIFGSTEDASEIGRAHV